MNTLDDPVFGLLTDVCQGLYAPRRLWQAEVHLESFKELVRVNVETSDELGVQDFHYQAFEHFKQHQARYKFLALESLLEFYQTTILPLWKDNDYFGVPELVPVVKTPEALENLLSLPHVYLHPPRDGVSSLGLSFECTWDVEHGTGVLLRGGKVIQTGSAEVASYDA